MTGSADRHAEDAPAAGPDPVHEHAPAERSGDEHTAAGRENPADTHVGPEGGGYPWPGRGLRIVAIEYVSDVRGVVSRLDHTPPQRLYNVDYQSAEVFFRRCATHPGDGVAPGGHHGQAGGRPATRARRPRPGSIPRGRARRTARCGPIRPGRGADAVRRAVRSPSRHRDHIRPLTHQFPPSHTTSDRRRPGVTSRVRRSRDGRRAPPAGWRGPRRDGAAAGRVPGPAPRGCRAGRR